MLCRNPYVTGKAAYGCGQCMNCRINKQREWAHRITLEAASHPLPSSFITLTYDDEHLPLDGSLQPKHTKQFIRQYVKHYGKTRYFTVGEYGGMFNRPHYHVILFGKGCCPNAPFSKTNCPCMYCNSIRATWRQGHILVGSVNSESAKYTAKYVTKKMTRKDDERLEERLPEFARMSLKPGIGANLMDDVADKLLKHNLNETLIDVPTSLTHGKKNEPLGKYLCQRLRERIGKDRATPWETAQRYSLDLQDLYAKATENDKDGFNRTQLFQKLLTEKTAGAAARQTRLAKR